MSIGQDPVAAGQAVLPAEVVAWLEQVVEPGARVQRVRSFSQSGVGGPWGIDLAGSDEPRSVVLQLGDASDPAVRGRFATEAAALRAAEEHAVAAPRVIAADVDASHLGAAALVTTLLRGSSRIAQQTSAGKLRALGAAAASIHAVPVEPQPTLPVRRRSLEGASLGDDVAGRSGELFRHARARVAAFDPEAVAGVGLVHGDLWHGNTLWDGEEYVGAIDWDFAGVGPAGIDLGSLRCDAAVLYGVDAADHVLGGWEAEHGAPAPDLAWWDLLSALATPPGMAGWLPNFHAQGRTDLTLDVVTARRDDHLAAAIAQL